MSAISTIAFVVALLAQQQPQENDRVGSSPMNGSAVAPTMRDGIGSVFALSSLTGGMGQGAILGGATGGSQDLYGTGTAGGLGGLNGMVGGAGPGGLAGMGGGASAMPGGLGAGMGAPHGAGMRGGMGYRSPSRHGPTLRAGLGMRGKGKGTATNFDLIGARSAATELDGLLKGLVAAGPLSPEEASLIVHAMVAANATDVKDPHARASLRDATRRMLAPTSSVAADALQTKLDGLTPAAPDAPAAPARPIDGDTIHAWFGALDASNDGAVSFLEWRDRTGLGIDVFRLVDTSGEGLIQYEELERTLVANAIAEDRPVDPALLDQFDPTAAASAALAATPDAASAAAKMEPPPKVPLDQLLKQVRSLLAKAAAEQSALAGEAPAGRTAAGAAGKTKAGGKAKAASAAPSPFDLLGTSPKPATKKPLPKKPVPHPGYTPSGN